MLVCVLQSFLCTSAQVPGPEMGGTWPEQKGLNVWVIGLHIIPGATGKHRGALILSLEHSIAISAAQTEDRRIEEKKKRKEGRGRAVPH